MIPGIFLVILAGLIIAALHRGAEQPASTPECGCQSDAWSEAIKTATHFPEQEYLH